MDPINNEKFGHFVAARRRALGLTQKELGDRLFVSDKTVSKWERGASLPNIALLQPLAEVLDVSVSELLNGECLTADAPLAASTADTIVTNALDFSLREAMAHQKRHRLAALFITCALVLGETALLKALASPPDMENLAMSALFLLFAAWGIFFAKPLLPAYYDENKIHFVQQGPFRLNMIGLHFNNSNWPHILRWLRGTMLFFAVLMPFFPMIVTHMPLPPQTLTLLLCVLLFAPLYVIGKRYE